MKLTNTQISDIYTFVRKDLCYKYNMRIDVEETQIVEGVIGKDRIVDAIKIVFFPSEAVSDDMKPGSLDYIHKISYVENRIIEDIHRFCYENGIVMSLNFGIERDVWLGEIRYKLVYTTD